MMFGIFMGTIRGGSSDSTVVIGDGEIVAPPIVPSVWGVVAMHPAGLAGLGPKVERGGVAVLNSTLVTVPPAWDAVRMLAVPATEVAKAMGQPLGASMVALGAFARATGLVTLDSLQAALADVLPAHRRKLIDANRLCLARGAESVGEGAARAST